MWYSNRSHTLSYSLIALQELNLCYKYNPLYWNTANLTVDSGVLKQNGATDYGKVAGAVSYVQGEGVVVAPPLINEAEQSFLPDVEHNRILFGFRAIKQIGSDVVEEVLRKRPFTSFTDFLEKVDRKIVTDSKVIQLIKASSFSEFGTDEEIMKQFISTLITPREKLGLSQLRIAVSNEVLTPENPIYAKYRMTGFKEYIFSDKFLRKTVIHKDKKIPKIGYHDRYFILDKQAQDFFKEYYTEDCVVDCVGERYVISEKGFERQWKKHMEELIQWMNRPETIAAYNQGLFNAAWKNYTKTQPLHWTIDSLGYYSKEHELSFVDENQYGIVDFFSLPETPPAYDHYYRWVKDESGQKKQKRIPKYEINRIWGAVIEFNKDKYMISLLTPTGVVLCKFTKGEYLFYNRRLSQEDESGKKTVLEEGWFKRGTLIMVAGYRSGDYWRAYKYADSIYKHTVTRINNLVRQPDGSCTIEFQSERVTENVESS